MHVEALSLFRDCMRSGMRDVGCHLGEWIFASHEDPSDDHSTVLVNEDTSNESESNNNNNNDNNNNDNNNADPSNNNNNNNNNNNSLAPPDGVSVTVGLPTRFGNPASPSHEDADAGASPSPEDTAIDTNTNNIFREQQILRKLTVHDESALRTAIDNLGLKAVLDYVHHFQETQERERDSDAESVDPDAFTRGLEQVCLLYEKENSNARAPDAGVETHDATDVNNTLNQHTTTLHPDPYVMSMNPYMESMSGYYHHPNFCYGPYPPFAGYAPFNVSVPPMYMPMMGVPYFTPPGAHEYVPATADAMNRASRKSRIARRRVLGSDPRHHLPRSAAKPAAHGGGGGGVQTQNANLAVGSAGQGLNTNDLMFLLAKQLSPSGVSSLGRIVLPKKEAEAHLPHLVASEGVLLTMADFDTCQSWTFRYRFWSNNKSRMYLLENTRDFVKAHNLQERDMLVLYRDAGGSYVVRGEKNGVNNQVRDAAGGMAAVEDALTGDEVSKKKQKV